MSHPGYPNLPQQPQVHQRQPPSAPQYPPQQPVQQFIVTVSYNFFIILYLEIYIYPMQTGSFGENPTNVTCPNCKTQVVTQINYENGALTWLIVGALFCSG